MECLHHPATHVLRSERLCDRDGEVGAALHRAVIGGDAAVAASHFGDH